MPRISQEFHCSKAGDGCGKYFVVRLNMALSVEVEIICPACGHKHRRYIKDGVIRDDLRCKHDVKETLRPSPATLSDEPATEKMRKAQAGTVRNGVELDGATLDDFRQRWLTVAARERGEDDE